MTVPNFSEHLSSAETTTQLSARFGTVTACCGMATVSPGRIAYSTCYAIHDRVRREVLAQPSMTFRVDKLNAISADGLSAPMALQVVFVDDLHGSGEGRQPTLHFEPAAVEGAIQRVKDYEALFPSGSVKHVTNSTALAKLYVERFRAAGLKNYSFMVIPAVLQKS